MAKLFLSIFFFFLMETNIVKAAQNNLIMDEFWHVAKSKSGQGVFLCCQWGGVCVGRGGLLTSNCLFGCWRAECDTLMHILVMVQSTLVLQGLTNKKLCPGTNNSRAFVYSHGHLFLAGTALVTEAGAFSTKEDWPSHRDLQATSLSTENVE